MIRDKGLAFDAATVALTAARQAGVHMQLAGGMALEARGLLNRTTTDINLVTTAAHDSHRLLDTVRQAMVGARYAVGEVGTPPGPGTRAALMFQYGDSHWMRLQLARQPEYAPAEWANNWPVSSLTSHLVRTLQAVEGRPEPPTYVDLLALAQHIGTEQLNKFIGQWLPPVARARHQPLAVAYQELATRVAHGTTLPPATYNWYGLPEAQILQLHQALNQLSAQIRDAADAVPLPGSPTPAVLQELSPQELAAMRAALLAEGVTEADIRARLPRRPPAGPGPATPTPHHPDTQPDQQAPQPPLPRGPAPR